MRIGARFLASALFLVGCDSSSHGRSADDQLTILPWNSIAIDTSGFDHMLVQLGETRTSFGDH